MKLKFRYLIGVLLLLVLVGPWLAPHDPTVPRLAEKLFAPGTTGHWLGTDTNGRDILSLILHGARLSLLISTAVVAVCLSVGLVAGFLAGFLGGWTDRVFLMIADIVQAFPGILLAIAVAAFLPPSAVNIVLVLSLAGWVGYARVARAQVLELRGREFVLAGEALGVRLPRLLMRYFLPNMAGPMIVQASFGMAGVILAESTLSYLGLGLPAHVPSLGKLLDSGVSLMLRAPYVALFPGFVIMAFVLLFNLIGDRLRAKLA